MHWTEFNVKMKRMSVDYMDHNKQSRRQMYRTYINTYVKEDMNNFPAGSIWNNMIVNECVSFGNCVTATPTPCYPAECNKSDLEFYIRPNKQKGNNPMYVDNDKHIESSKINYLADRAATARYAVQDKIEVTFNLRKPEPPKTPEALVDAITSGNYTVIPKADRNHYHGALDSIIWRAPTVVADEAGAQAATKVFDTLYKSAQDAIMISTPAEALTAVQALDAWTPVAGTVAS